MDLPLQTLPQELQVTDLTRNLVTTIVQNNPVALKEIVRNYLERGQPKFVDLMSVPTSERINALKTSWGPMPVHAILVTLITRLVNQINVTNNMSEDQIINCAADVMDLSIEYNLSLQDLVLFFDQAKTGKYGKIFNRLDTQIVLGFLDTYLDHRHEALVQYREEERLRYSSDSRGVDRLTQGAISIGNAFGNMKQHFKKD